MVLSTTSRWRGQSPGQRAVPEGAARVQAMTAGACVGWMAVSSALIMINKYLMSSDGFRFPMALSCLGMLFSSLASYLACRVRACKPA